MLNVHDYHSNPSTLDPQATAYFKKRYEFLNHLYSELEHIADEARIEVEIGDIDKDEISVYASGDNERHNPGEMLIAISNTPSFLPIIELDEHDKPKHTYHSVSELIGEVIGRYASPDEDD